MNELLKSNRNADANAERITLNFMCYTPVRTNNNKIDKQLAMSYKIYNQYKTKNPE